MLEHLSFFPLVIIGVLNFFLGIIVWMSDNRKLSNISFLGLTISVGMWCMGIAAFLWAKDMYMALLWTRLYYLAPALLVFFLVLFGLTFPDRKISKMKFSILIFPFAIFFLSSLLNENLIIQSLHIIGDARQVSLNNTPYLFYGSYIIGYFAIGLIVLARKSRDGSKESKQTVVFLWGAIVSAILGLIFNLILPYIGNYRVIWVGPISTSIFVFASAITIARYRMFDVRFYVVRIVVYTVASVLLSVLYVAPLLYLVTKTVGVDMSFRKFLMVVIGSSIIAGYYMAVRQWFNRVTRKYFFQDSYDAARLLDDLNKTLVNTLDVNDIVKSTIVLLEDTVKSEYITFAFASPRTRGGFRMMGMRIKDDGKLTTLLRLANSNKDQVLVFGMLDPDLYISRVAKYNDVAMLVKLNEKKTSNELPLGYLILGQKKSGSSYSLQDARALGTIANTLVIAIQNAQHYEEIQQFNVTLQGKVDEATRKMRSSNERLKKLDETKDEFVSMASHQLRTPLTSVKGYLSMVLEGDAGPLNPQQEQLLTQSFQSSQRMVNLIADLLNLSRLNTGKFVIDAQPTDLRVIVDQEVSQLRETAKAKNIALEWTMPQTFSLLSLDEGKIHQVVMNFIDNAIYYTPEGGNIDIVLEETPKTVELRVKDSGIGVPRDMQHKLFGKFYRADNARRMRPDGTGLGLYMAKKVVVAQGGSIIFESTENKGSTFGFCFRKSDAGGRKHSLPA